MSKKTTSLMDIYQSELIRRGFNDFFDGQHLRFYDRTHIKLIKKVMSYDEQVEEITNTLFFQDFFFDEKIDKVFKRAFVNRFLHREINRQTIEAFSAQLYYFCVTHEHYINEICLNYLEYAHQKAHATSEYDGIHHSENTSNSSSSGNSNTTGNSQSENEGNATHDNRTIHSDLPQTQINMNLNDDSIDYASTNDMSKSQEANSSSSTNDNTSNTDTTSTTDSSDLTNTHDHTKNTNFSYDYNLSVFLQTSEVFTKIFDKLDLACFLQVW